jgi:thiamine biosynthesis lipoprotein
MEIRRCRPLLGTFVEITVTGTSAEKLERGMSAAFASVEKAHGLMSVYDPESDISRINRQAFRRSVVVHPWTWRVLEAAQELSRDSGGVFDPTVARPGRGSWADIALEKNCAVRLRRRVMVDLGGIAKGFAVDRAVDTLMGNGIERGIVNAGGDLRVFGPAPQLVHLRHPAEPARAAGALRVRNRAVATSAGYFAPKALFDGRNRRGLPSNISVSVAADECMIADALTKIVVALREGAAPLLKRYHASALILDWGGAPHWVFQTHAA